MATTSATHSGPRGPTARKFMRYESWTDLTNNDNDAVVEKMKSFGSGGKIRFTEEFIIPADLEA